MQFVWTFACILTPEVEDLKLACLRNSRTIYARVFVNYLGVGLGTRKARPTQQTPDSLYTRYGWSWPLAQAPGERAPASGCNFMCIDTCFPVSSLKHLQPPMYLHSLVVLAAMVGSTEAIPERPAPHLDQKEAGTGNRTASPSFRVRAFFLLPIIQTAWQKPTRTPTRPATARSL